MSNAGQGITVKNENVWLTEGLRYRRNTTGEYELPISKTKSSDDRIGFTVWPIGGRAYRRAVEESDKNLTEGEFAVSLYEATFTMDFAGKKVSTIMEVINDR